MNLRLATSAPLAVVVAVAGIAAYWAFYKPSDHERVEAYCAYLTQSGTAWRSCMDGTTIEQVRAQDSGAGRYARDGGDCPSASMCDELKRARRSCRRDQRPSNVGDCVRRRIDGRASVLDAVGR